MSNANLIRRSLERDHAIVIALLVLIIGASWAFILAGSGTGMSTFGMTSLTMALGMAEHIAGCSRHAHGLDGSLRAGDVHHVVGDDDRHDASQRSAYDPASRQGR